MQYDWEDLILGYHALGIPYFQMRVLPWGIGGRTKSLQCLAILSIFLSEVFTFLPKVVVLGFWNFTWVFYSIVNMFQFQRDGDKELSFHCFLYLHYNHAYCINFLDYFVHLNIFSCVLLSKTNFMLYNISVLSFWPWA